MLWQFHKNIWSKIIFAIVLGHRLIAMTPSEISEKRKTLTNVQDEEFQKIAENLRCPTCTGLSILESNASFSLQIQQEVIEQVKQGHKEKVILDFFTTRYGAWILRQPPKEGFHLLAWLLPLFFIFFGSIFVLQIYWRRKPNDTKKVLRSQKSVLSQLQDELKKLKQKEGVT